MPHLFSFANHAVTDDALQELGPELPPKRRRGQSLLRKPLSLLRRQPQLEDGKLPATTFPATAPTEAANIPEYFPPTPTERRPSLPENVSRRAIPSLPRQQTFTRQESERRDNLLEIEPTHNERRALSVDRRRSRGVSASRDLRPLLPPPVPLLSPSPPEVSDADQYESTPSDTLASLPQPPVKPSVKDLPPLNIPDASEQPPLLLENDVDDRGSALERSSLHEEFDRRWILNLSMHFRDKSNREKFFVTYAEKPNQWRRVTVSLDYRDAPPDSLEADLSTLHFQRDKSLRIYEAIRESLPDIQYYDTVTNLKLETTPSDGQLHVHVREDANETIEYPCMSLFNHVRCPRFNESALEFDSHLSGFVYKVRLADRLLIKKEIPGPDTVDEFLYEVNALDSLLETENVVRLEGLVTDDRGEHVKALLLNYASQGALVDMIYDFKGTSSLSWHRREKWAQQIVGGLADIHEAGFVQGDFTLSNIVIDEDDNAQIIDINRRGCPVGWEPPELSKLIDSGQRIGMCIGVKTDVFQLGMVLWALAEEVDEPERVERPLPLVYEDIPAYFREIVRTCLSERPQDRMHAKQLLDFFPASAGQSNTHGRLGAPFYQSLQASDHSQSTSTHRSAKEYIDPKLAVTIEEVQEKRRSGSPVASNYDSEQVTYVNPESNPGSSTYRFESSGSWVVGRQSRGRSPVSSRRRRSSPYGRAASSATSLSANSPLPKFDYDEMNAAIHERAPPSSCAVSDADFAEHRAPHKRLTAIQDSGRIRELIHADSGFDEHMDDLDIDNSTLTELERPKCYVPDDEPREFEEPPQTPSSWHTALATPGVDRRGSAGLLRDESSDETTM